MTITTDASEQETRTPGFCALCKSRCGSVMVTQAGRFLRQEPNPEHPTGKALCVKGKAAAEIVYRASRQLHPLKRTRPKGDADPGWERISWDEALQTVAVRLAQVRDESGAEAVAFGCTTPSGTPIADDLRWIERFTNAFGSPNVAQGTEICNWHKDYAHAYTFGRGVSSPDFARTGCIVFWGHNPSATWLDHAMAAGAAVARGAKLVVVDPRRAGMAAKADHWLRVRPGADNALALGLAREMLRQGWYDEDFVRRWTNGPLLVRSDNGRFLRAVDLAAPPEGVPADDLLALSDGTEGRRWLPCSPTRRAQPLPGDAALFGSVDVDLADGRTIPCRTALSLHRELCEPWTPERVHEIAWVDPGQIEAVARLLHESGPVCFYGWSGIGQHTNATQTDRAIAIVMALTGSVDAPGGNVQFGKPPSNQVSGEELLSAEQRAKCVELARSRLGPGAHGWIGSDALADAILDARPYRLRALMNFGRNFLVNHAHGARLADALRSLEFFVHADVVMSPTAELADIFLPINTPWEREALRVGFEGSAPAESLVQLRQAVIDSRGESRSDGQVVFELAQRLGLGHLFWDGDSTAGLNHVLAPTGLTVDALRAQPGGIRLETVTDYHAYRRHGFKTATGKVEIYSEVFLEQGQPPLPAFVEPAASPMTGAARHDAFPLVLTSAKVVQFCHGQHRDIPSLRRRSPDPELSLSPAAAMARGIADGDDVRLQTPLGSAMFKARLDRSLDERVVCAQYGWWQDNGELSLPGYDALKESGASVNRLVDDRVTDPISGSVGLRSSLCEVRRVGGRAEAA